MDNLFVRTMRKNKEMETLVDKECSLADYSAMMKVDLHQVISDVETLVYHIVRKPKDEWDDETWALFTRIRHKLLDKAGDIGRLSENIVSID